MKKKIILIFVEILVKLHILTPIRVAKLKFFLDGVLNVTHQQGGQQVIHNGKEHDEEHGDEALPVGLCIPQEPGDDLGVGHIPLPVGHIFLLLLQGQPGQDEHDGESADDGAYDDHGQKFTEDLSHFARLLPLQGAAGLPFCGRPGRCCTVRRGSPQR